MFANLYICSSINFKFAMMINTYYLSSVVGLPIPSKKLTKTFGIFLFKAVNNIRKYHHFPRFQKHLVTKAAFDLQGKISRCQISA